MFKMVAFLPRRKHEGTFSDTGNLVELLEVNLTIPWGPLMTGSLEFLTLTCSL